MKAIDITLENVSKKFDSYVALEDVSLKIEKGEFVCIIGPTGCGKTVLLRLINGFERPSEGRIYFGDKIVNDVPAHRRGAPTVFQNFALFPHMKVYQNIEYGLKVAKLPEAERRRKVRDIMEKLDILPLADRYPGQISGGQKQRVGLARALVVEPSVLLLDEPLGALDANLRVRMQSELKVLHKRLGITFILVTSNRTEAFVMGDRVIVMERARIAQVGRPEEIKNSPVSESVARFCGSTNIFSGRVVSLEAGAMRVESAIGAIRLALPSEPVKAGDQVKLFLRPDGIIIGGQKMAPTPSQPLEACTIFGERPPQPDDNHLQARFKHGEFVGSVATLFFELENGAEIEVEKHIAKVGELKRGNIYDLYFNLGCAGVIR